MQRFILQSNIEHFERILVDETSADDREIVTALLASARRELALLDAASFGAHLSLTPRRAGFQLTQSVQEAQRSFQRVFEHSSKAYLVIDPRPGLHIVDMTDAYASATLIDRSAIAGMPLFEAFPDNPVRTAADGVTNLYASIKTVVHSSRPHTMAIQRYDIRDATGAFIERYWRPVNTPLFDDHGEIKFILHQVEDVTNTQKHTPS